MLVLVLSTSAVMFMVRSRSIRKIVDGPLPGVRVATCERGTWRPSGVVTRYSSRVAVVLLSSLGSRTITRISSRPRWMRWASKPRNAWLTWFATAARVRPSTWPCRVSSICSSSLPSDRLSEISNTVGYVARRCLICSPAASSVSSDWAFS